MQALNVGVRWRRPRPAESADIADRLASWPCPPGGAVRHMFPLATLENRGPGAFRVADSDSGWAVCVTQPGQLIVPCGDPDTISRAGLPLRRWRLIVGDAAAADAVLAHWNADPALIIHVQRFQVVDPDRVPGEEEVGDPGLRPAAPEDVAGLTELAVQLHIEDGYGPPPGRAARRSYEQRMQTAVRRGTMLCVGPPGDPMAKIERSVNSARWGVQLSGIVVREGSRGEGLGRAAVAAAVRCSLAERPGRPISLHVRADNVAALRAYAGAGFVDKEEWRLAVRS